MARTRYGLWLVERKLIKVRCRWPRAVDNVPACEQLVVPGIRIDSYRIDLGAR